MCINALEIVHALTSINGAGRHTRTHTQHTGAWAPSKCENISVISLSTNARDRLCPAPVRLQVDALNGRTTVRYYCCYTLELCFPSSSLVCPWACFLLFSLCDCVFGCGDFKLDGRSTFNNELFDGNIWCIYLYIYIIHMSNRSECEWCLEKFSSFH